MGSSFASPRRVRGRRHDASRAVGPSLPHRAGDHGPQGCGDDVGPSGGSSLSLTQRGG